MSRFPWFHINSLQAQCDKGAWSRGMDLFRRAGVVRTDIEAEGNGCWHIEGEVQGSMPEPYEVSVELVIAPNGQLTLWSGDCSCPVGEDCKHAVALTLQAAHQNPAQAHNTAQQIDTAVNQMIAQCKLKPDADAALHGLLVKFIAGAKAVRESQDAPMPQINAMREALVQYPQLFNDPGWAK